MTQNIHSLGGKARWKGISKKDRSTIMKKVRNTPSKENARKATEAKAKKKPSDHHFMEKMAHELETGDDSI